MDETENRDSGTPSQNAEFDIAEIFGSTPSRAANSPADDDLSQKPWYARMMDLWSDNPPGTPPAFGFGWQIGEDIGTQRAKDKGWSR